MGLDVLCEHVNIMATAVPFDLPTGYLSSLLYFYCMSTSIHMETDQSHTKVTNIYNTKLQISM